MAEKLVKDSQGLAKDLANDAISRQEAIDIVNKYDKSHMILMGKPMLGATSIVIELEDLPSAQPEQPLYVAEIEAEYQKAVKMPHIHKPLAKALYEVWKKHDREDAERRTDG